MEKKPDDGVKRVVTFERNSSNADSVSVREGSVNESSSFVEQGRFCMVCKKSPATYGPAECDGCGCVYCKRCAMKFATGGRCKKCGKLFASMKRYEQ